MCSVMLAEHAGLSVAAEPALDDAVDWIGLDPPARWKPEWWPAGMTHDTALKEFGKLARRNSAQIARQLVGNAIIAVWTAFRRVGWQVGDQRLPTCKTLFDPLVEL